MPLNSEKFSDYSFSEYTQPTQLDKADYTDPRFYQHENAPQPTLPMQPGSEQYPPAPGVYETAQMQEYRGPASLENYTVDAGIEQRVAAQNGNVDAGATRKKGLAALGGMGAALGLTLKFGIAGITALASIVVYAQLFGWGFGIGLVVLLFIHEMGHAVVMKLKGIPIGGMIFIPMLGAAVFMRRMPGNAKDEAEVGIAGPVAGALASLVCLFIALSVSSSTGFTGIWAPLAYFGFFLNLFNLIPIIPFDGGRVLAAIDRRVWLIGFIGLLAVQIWEWVTGNFSIWLLIFIVLAATQLWTRRRASDTPESQAYYAVSRGERIIIGLAYFGLIAVLVLGMTAAHGLMTFAR
jgi:Zn-dependent protease